MIKTVNLKADDQLELFLGPLEARVMRLVWSFGSTTVKVVFEQIQADHQVTYTTVATTMNRLVDKQLLERKPKLGYYIYNPVVKSETLFLNEALRITVSKLKKLGLI